MELIAGLDRRALDRARLSRDRRFDGRFFIAVTSTGIYCRPICPAPSPKKSNVRYYASAAAAAEAGFRPCLRCRPEAAPGRPAWMGTSTIVRRGLRLIQDGALDGASVDALAARVGIGERQLHRLFIQHVGASPITVAQTRRLHFAKRLLDETALPITEIALASGFGSVRRFNDAFLKTYERAPRDFRRMKRKGLAANAESAVVLRLAYRPPYDWAKVRDELARRAVPGVERVDDDGYARTFAVEGAAAIVCVRPVPNVPALELGVQGAAPGALFQLSAIARRAFDLESEPSQVVRTLKKDPILAPLVNSRRGVRISGAWDPFEGAVRAAFEIGLGYAKGQQALARIVATSGRALKDAPKGLTHLFPTPEALLAMRFEGVGVPSHLAAMAQGLAHATLEGALDFDAPPETVVRVLTGLAGARVAAEVALRALGDPDAFCGDDRALRSAVSPTGTTISVRALEDRAEAWRPWRGYAAVVLGAAGAAGGARRPPLFGHAP
jgi:AraC family transcriptional regulator of adaptative response / DNA-3-methyladenine glycosylase II